MKYFECIYSNGNETKIIELNNVSEQKAKELEGNIFCNGIDNNGVICMAPLTSAHNAYDGGKTMHFRAKNELHIEGCVYKDLKIDGGKKGTGTISDGYYTREQINSFVRELDNRLNKPKKIKKPGNKKPTIRKVETLDDESTSGSKVKGGTVIAGNKGIGKKGRMITRREISSDDIDSEVGVYGEIKSFDINQYGEVTIKYKETRLDNIQIKIGQIYKNNNPQEFDKLPRVKEYIKHLEKNGQPVYCVAAGLVTKYNENLVVALQTDYSFKLNSKNILDIIRIQF